MDQWSVFLICHMHHVDSISGLAESPCSSCTICFLCIYSEMGNQIHNIRHYMECAPYCILIILWWLNDYIMIILYNWLCCIGEFSNCTKLQLTVSNSYDKMLKWTTCTRFIHVRLIKATLFGLLCFIILKFYVRILLMPPKWRNSIPDCSKYEDTRIISEGDIPHFECDILKNDHKPGILNILRYLKPSWQIDKVIHVIIWSCFAQSVNGFTCRHLFRTCRNAIMASQCL